MDKEDFLRKLDSEGFPILRDTVNFINSIISGSLEHSIPEVARKIINDPGMSSRLIQMANSPIFNPGLFRVRTVTRAIITLGLKNVVNLAASLALMDDILKSNRKRQVLVIKKILNSIGRAIVARDLASLCGRLIPKTTVEPEEIYISGILYQIGEIALDLFLSDELIFRIRDEAIAKNIPLELARKYILGFSAKELTKDITKRWNLSPILLELTSPSGAKSPQALCVEMANKVVLSGFFRDFIFSPDPELFNFEDLPIVETIARNFNTSSSTVAEILKKTFQEVVKYLKFYATLFDLKDLISVFKLDDRQFMEVMDFYKIEESESQVEEEFQEEGLDFKLITNLSSEIVSLISRGIDDLNVLFSLIMESIYKGLKMDVVLLFLLSPDRNHCYTKFSFIKPGLGSILIPEKLPFQSVGKHIFSHMLEQSEPIMVVEESGGEILEMAKHSLVLPFISIPFFMATLFAGGRPIGFIYADKRLDPSKIDLKEAFLNFKLFISLANLGLKLFKV